MGNDLISYKSHPDKLLEKHILGVLSKTQKRTDSKIAELAVLFHDLGKINLNFQKKLDSENKDNSFGYSDHAYLSAYCFWCYLLENQENVREILGSNFRLKALIITAIVSKHHGNLPNMEDSFKRVEDNFQSSVNKMLNFLKTKPFLPIDKFCNQKLLENYEPFEIKFEESIFKNSRFSEKRIADWQQDSLSYFLETQFSFASLIEADKRDAGDKYLKEYYHFDSEIGKSIIELRKSLQTVFNNLSQKEDKSKLDELRTQLREESVKNLKIELINEQRIFTLTAPTGAGKTFTLLALASEIQKQKGEFGIIYCLPFLSITEQVESIAKNLLKLDVLSVNSKSENKGIDDAQSNLENNQSEENIAKLLQQDFIQHTFDHPFIITTFVQFFETLMSNRNSTLMKLPNFSNRIFLIDEVQALPPRLYIFFIAWIEYFCKTHNSYAIISTATMPKFDFKVKKQVELLRKPELLFKSYNSPKPLLQPERYFEADIFNRYRINIIDDDEFTILQLSHHIKCQEKSCLVILNTIKDTKELFSELEGEDNVYLLNTHFTPFDRRKKIENIKIDLQKGTKIILISTQLIEAGVDVDFPIVYRDLCPLPSLIQSSGRCNRNKKNDLGQVFSFHLQASDGTMNSAEKVYRKEAKDFLDFCKIHIQDGVEEKELFVIQSKFFEFISNNLSIGDYTIDKKTEVNLIECVNNAEFENLGKVKLINDKEFGYEYQFYIPDNEEDHEYEKAVELMYKMVKADGFTESKRWKIALNQQLKKLADKLITIRTFEKEKNLPFKRNLKDYFDIRVLSDLSLYTFEFGFEHDSVKNVFL